MKLIILASNSVKRKRSPYISESHSFYFAHLGEMGWENGLKKAVLEIYEDALKKLTENAALGHSINEIFLAGHAHPCFALPRESYFLEQSCLSQARELQHCCNCQQAVVAAFKHDNGSPLYGVLKALVDAVGADPPVITTDLMNKVDHAFRNTIPELIDSFLGGWRHALHNVLNPAKGYFELQAIGVEATQPNLIEVFKKAISICNDAILVSQNRSFPLRVEKYLEKVVIQLESAKNNSDKMEFLQWHPQFCAFLRQHQPVFSVSHDDKT